jgi:hypothetical protein
MRFECTAYPDELGIDSVAVFNESMLNGVEKGVYKGPSFEDLGESFLSSCRVDLTFCQLGISKIRFTNI